MASVMPSIVLSLPSTQDMMESAGQMIDRALQEDRMYLDLADLLRVPAHSKQILHIFQLVMPLLVMQLNVLMKPFVACGSLIFHQYSIKLSLICGLKSPRGAHSGECLVCKRGAITHKRRSPLPLWSLLILALSHHHTWKDLPASWVFHRHATLM